MQSPMSEMSEAEISRRLTSYDSPDVTKELYQFGVMLLNEVRQRVTDLDAKATKIAGYSGAVIVLFISTFKNWSNNLSTVGTVFVWFGIATVAIAGIMAVLVPAIAKFSWFSGNEWFRQECLDDADSLQRYHLLTMHGVIESHESLCFWKVKLIRWSGYALALAFLLILGGLYTST